MHRPLNEENSLRKKSMYNSYSEWNTCINNLEDCYDNDDIYNAGVGSVFTTNQFHELTLPARPIVDECIWMAPDTEENTFHSTQRLFDCLNHAQIYNDPDYSVIQSYWNNHDKEHFPNSNSQVSVQNRYSNVNQASLDVNDLPSVNNGFGRTLTDNSSVSHTSNLHGVRVAPKKDTDADLGIIKSKFKNSSDDTSSLETSNSDVRRRVHFSRQKSDTMEGTRIKTDSYKYKNDEEISMLIASGGAPLGRLDEIGCVEWYPERQSWKVVGHTGISWCVRRKTWRVWFITSGGTRATRSFNPKEHGTVAAALKAAIEFLVFKRAEKLPTQKNLRGRARRSSLYSNNPANDEFSKSNSISLNGNTYKHESGLIN